MPLPRPFKRHKDFIGNVATMMSGRAIAAAIALLTMPIVARLFSPGDFGVAAMFVSITSIVATVSSLRYELALVLPKEEPEALTLLAFTYSVLISTCLIMLLLIAGLETTGISVPPLDLLGNWIWLLPLSVLLLGTTNIQESWLTRKKQFKVASASLVVGNAATSGTRIAFGVLSGSSAWGLITGYLLGAISRCAMQQRAIRSISFPAVYRESEWREMREVARRYSDFPRLNAPAGAIFSLGQNLPVLLFGAMFTPAVVGHYAMAYRLTEVPVSIVANSIRKVFLQKAADIAARNGNLRRAFLLTIAGLAAIGILPLAIVGLAGQPMLAWLLGDRWMIAGAYLEILAPLLFMVWVASPTNAVFIVLRKQLAWLALQTTLTLLRVASFGFAFALGADAEWTLKAFVAVTVAGYLIEIGIALLFVSRPAAAAAE